MQFLLRDSALLTAELPNIQYVVCLFVGQAFITPESEKACWRVGITNRKLFAHTESFCAYIKNGPEIKSKHSISLESFSTVWKVSEQSGKFLDSLESFQTD